MGKRNVGNCLDFRHFEYSKIGLPLVEAIERIMIGAEVVGQASPANSALEHLAECDAIHDASMDAKPDQAPGKLVHHHQNPIASQGDNLLD